MICNFCLEDKDISEFYVSGINKINRNCKNCTQIINTKSKIKKKNVEIQVLNNKHTRIKINKKYWITANSTKAKKRVFIGKLKEIYPDYLLFESKNGYMESFHKSVFVDDYIIRKIN